MTSWDIIIYRQNLHDTLHTGIDRERPIADLDRSCHIYNSTDSYQSAWFQNFWNYLANNLNAVRFNNQTILAFDSFRRNIRLYNDKQEASIDPQAELDAAYYETDKLVSSIRFSVSPATTIEDFQRIIVQVGAETRGFTNIENIDFYHQRVITQLKGKGRDNSQGTSS